MCFVDFLNKIFLKKVHTLGLVSSNDVLLIKIQHLIIKWYGMV